MYSTESREIGIRVRFWSDMDERAAEHRPEQQIGEGRGGVTRREQGQGERTRDTDQDLEAVGAVLLCPVVDERRG